MSVATMLASPFIFGQTSLESCLRIAKRMRYWDGIRPEDEEDFVQDVLLEMMDRARRNGGDLSEKEKWRAARCVRNRYRRAYARKVISLNTLIQDTEMPVELWETLPDKGIDLDAWLDAKMRLGELPPGVLLIARKLEKGDPLTRGQQAYLVRFRQDGKPSPQRVYEMNRYLNLHSRGLCVSCGEESGGSVRCPRCQERFRAYQKRHRRRKGKAWMHTLRAHWRRQGRCPRCGRVPEPGHKKCPHCLAKNREYLQHYRERHREACIPAAPTGTSEDRTGGSNPRRPG